MPHMICLLNDTFFHSVAVFSLIPFTYILSTMKVYHSSAKYARKACAGPNNGHPSRLVLKYSLMKNPDCPVLNKVYLFATFNFHFQYLIFFITIYRDYILIFTSFFNIDCYTIISIRYTAQL